MYTPPCFLHQCYPPRVSKMIVCNAAKHHLCTIDFWTSHIYQELKLVSNKVLSKGGFQASKPPPTKTSARSKPMSQLVAAPAVGVQRVQGYTKGDIATIHSQAMTEVPSAPKTPQRSDAAWPSIDCTTLFKTQVSTQTKTRRSRNGPCPEVRPQEVARTGRSCCFLGQVWDQPFPGLFAGRGPMR